MEHCSNFSLINALSQCCCFGGGDEDNPLEGLEHMEILAELGEGAAGKIFRCRNQNTDRIYSVKRNQIPYGDERSRYRSLLAELVARHHQLPHQNILRLLDYKVPENKNRKYGYLIFEPMDCNLHSYITNHGNNVDSITRKSFMRQIITALAFCHEERVRKVFTRVHLKSKNLFINEATHRIKLTDFGYREDSNAAENENLGAGSYKAPEMQLGYPYSRPADLWSVGCIFCEMVTGEPIFQAQDDCQTELEAIFKVLGTPTEETWPGITALCPDLENYARFIHMDQLTTTFADLGPDGLDLLRRLLCLDPNQRISAAIALEHAYFQ